MGYCLFGRSLLWLPSARKLAKEAMVMSSGPQRIRLPEIVRVVTGLARAAGVEPKDVHVKVNRDASWTVYVPPHPQADDKPLADSGEIIL
jgi:hypothetical protein